MPDRRRHRASHRPLHQPRARRSRLQAFVKLAATIRKHHAGILATVRLGATTARAKTINNKVRLIVRRAYGFHSATAALALIMLSCGPVDLHLPQELHPHS